MKRVVGFDLNYRLRLPTEKQSDKKLGSLIKDESMKEELDSGDALFCCQCHQVITTETDRINIQGAHQHCFANPYGIIFQIGCFQTAKGCGYTGSLTEKWSWFKGLSWRIAICNMCLIQLGWLYVSPGGESFNGLILNRLISDDEKII